eukprot:gene1179-32515_t
MARIDAAKKDHLNLVHRRAMRQKEQVGEAGVPNESPYQRHRRSSLVALNDRMASVLGEGMGFDGGVESWVSHLESVCKAEKEEKIRVVEESEAKAAEEAKIAAKTWICAADEWGKESEGDSDDPVHDFGTAPAQRFANNLLVVGSQSAVPDSVRGSTGLLAAPAQPGSKRGMLPGSVVALEPAPVLAPAQPGSKRGMLPGSAVALEPAPVLAPAQPGSKRGMLPGSAVALEPAPVLAPAQPGSKRGMLPGSAVALEPAPVLEPAQPGSKRGMLPGSAGALEPAPVLAPAQPVTTNISSPNSQHRRLKQMGRGGGASTRMKKGSRVDQEGFVMATPGGAADMDMGSRVDQEGFVIATPGGAADMDMGSRVDHEGFVIPTRCSPLRLPPGGAADKEGPVVPSPIPKGMNPLDSSAQASFEVGGQSVGSTSITSMGATSVGSGYGSSGNFGAASTQGGDKIYNVAGMNPKPKPKTDTCPAKDPPAPSAPHPGPHPTQGMPPRTRGHRRSVDSLAMDCQPGRPLVPARSHRRSVDSLAMDCQPGSPLVAPGIPLRHAPFGASQRSSVDSITSSNAYRGGPSLMSPGGAGPGGAAPLKSPAKAGGGPSVPMETMYTPQGRSRRASMDHLSVYPLALGGPSLGSPRRSLPGQSPLGKGQSHEEKSAGGEPKTSSTCWRSSDLGLGLGQTHSMHHGYSQRAKAAGLSSLSECWECG